jgi:hypothetical protein
VSAIEPSDDGTYIALNARAQRAKYRLCQNAVDYGVCSWAVAADDTQGGGLCVSCRLNSVIPDLSTPEAILHWGKLELGKRRMLYTIMELELPIENRFERPENGLSFAFMKGKKVLTGQDNGLITINLAEADDPHREQVREMMGEAYRTVLGHFRHEVGHYYWDRLIRDSPRLQQCRALFGDETYDYQEALDKHYKQGTPSDWPQSFVSAYATMHPWEDWAETWAHYLHMVDTLETARSYGIVVQQHPLDAPPLPTVTMRQLDFSNFDTLIESWIPLTLALNSLDRSMGHADSYPFVLSAPALEKLRFVHDVVLQSRVTNQVSAPSSASAATTNEGGAPNDGAAAPTPIAAGHASARNDGAVEQATNDAAVQATKDAEATASG